MARWGTKIDAKTSSYNTYYPGTTYVYTYLLQVRWGWNLNLQHNILRYHLFIHSPVKAEVGWGLKHNLLRYHLFIHLPVKDVVGAETSLYNTTYPGTEPPTYTITC